MDFKAKIMIGILAVSLLMIAGCGQSEQETSEPNDGFIIDSGREDIQQQGISVLASVNGQEITSEQIFMVQQQFLEQGQELSSEQALEQTINQLVLEESAKDAGYEFSAADVEEQIETQLSSQNFSLEEYKSMLADQGISFDEMIEEYRSEFAIQYFLNDKLGDLEFSITDAEVEEFYNMYSQQLGEEAPSLDEIEVQIVSTLEQQRYYEALDALIEQLREESDIEYS